MASRAIQSLLASRHEWSRPHRIVVRVGAAAAWLAAAFYLAAAALTGDETWILESIGPVLAAGLMTVQILVGKEDGGLALFGSAVIVVIWSSAFGEHGTTVPAAVSLVLICSLGMLFVRRHRAMLALTDEFEKFDDVIDIIVEIEAAVYEDEIRRSAGARRALVAERHLHRRRSQQCRDVGAK